MYKRTLSLSLSFQSNLRKTIVRVGVKFRPMKELMTMEIELEAKSSLGVCPCRLVCYFHLKQMPMTKDESQNKGTKTKQKMTIKQRDDFSILNIAANTSRQKRESFFFLLSFDFLQYSLILPSATLAIRIDERTVSVFGPMEEHQ